MTKLKIAVIGKSAAGKSAFIRTFSSAPDYINSVGKGQTTRAYAEYLFLQDYEDDFPKVEADIVTQSMFCESRTMQVLGKLKDLQNSGESTDIDWLKKQFDNGVHKRRLKEILLYATDFFDIREFEFLDNNIVSWSDMEFDAFEKDIVSTADNEKILNEGEQEEKEKKETEADDILYKFFRNIYDKIIMVIKEAYKNKPVFYIDNNICHFKFRIEDNETKNIFTMLLKVDDDNKSLTGMLSKVRITSGINKKYLEKLNCLNIYSISLIDTYGLDHSENTKDEVLIERYNRIFNKDYPEISVVFFVEALHAGASNEFKKAITILYQIKPEIMTYIIGTYIDENENELLGKENWLFSEEKRKDGAPRLNGRVQQILDNDTDLQAALLDQGISESMAQKRCEIMQKRFAPFCGNLDNITGKIDYEMANTVSIKALFSSIAEKEHLGEGYIQIDAILEKISQEGILDTFSKQFIENIKKGFVQVYARSASRTRWKIRENLENYVLGFMGTTLDATWKRVFKDAFNMTFTKKIKADGRMQMLSDVLKIEGNSKIAFDEIIATIAPFLLQRKCQGEEYLSPSVCEIKCNECAENQTKDSGCIWNIFIIAASFEAFTERSHYDKVIDWLNELHKFEQIDNLEEKVTKHLQSVLSEKFVPLCREHNMRLASKRIKNSNAPYADSKKEVYLDYKTKYDTAIEKKRFDDIVNSFLSNEMR